MVFGGANSPPFHRLDRSGMGGLYSIWVKMGEWWVHAKMVKKLFLFFSTLKTHTRLLRFQIFWFDSSRGRILFTFWDRRPFLRDLRFFWNFEVFGLTPSLCSLGSISPDSCRIPLGWRFWAKLGPKTLRSSIFTFLTRLLFSISLFWGTCWSLSDFLLPKFDSATSNWPELWRLGGKYLTEN